MLKNPALYNPVLNKEEATKRRNVVFNQMVKNKMITKEEFDSLKTLPLGIKISRQTHIDGLAPYFRDGISQVC